MTDRYMVREYLAAIQPQFVVNCAGVSLPDDPHREIEVNLGGSLNVALESWVPTILIASVAGLYGKPNHAGYCASKAGVISLVQSYAEEGKRVWAISPGRVDTPMRERDYPDDTPGSRLRPEQIGTAVIDIFLSEVYDPGTNVVIRKEGLNTVITHAHKGDGWKDRLRVGQPKTI